MGDGAQLPSREPLSATMLAELAWDSGGDPARYTQDPEVIPAPKRQKSGLVMSNDMGQHPKGSSHVIGGVCAEWPLLLSYSGLYLSLWRTRVVRPGGSHLSWAMRRLSLLLGLG